MSQNIQYAQQLQDLITKGEELMKGYAGLHLVVKHLKPEAAPTEWEYVSQTVGSTLSNAHKLLSSVIQDSKHRTQMVVSQQEPYSTGRTEADQQEADAVDEQIGGGDDFVRSRSATPISVDVPSLPPSPGLPPQLEEVRLSTSAIKDASPTPPEADLVSYCQVIRPFMGLHTYAPLIGDDRSQKIRTLRQDILSIHEDILTTVAPSTDLAQKVITRYRKEARYRGSLIFHLARRDQGDGVI
ncbi:hypothetical protein FRC01_012971 [Tulasnella sp. 417]|nr:hypothetical protein FRC01_012971 [Tulasnella sp. 417]